MYFIVIEDLKTFLFNQALVVLVLLSRSRSMFLRMMSLYNEILTSSKFLRITEFNSSYA